MSSFTMFSIPGSMSSYHAHSFFHLRPNLAIPCAFVFLPQEGQFRYSIHMPCLWCVVFANMIFKWILSSQSLPGHQNLFFQMKLFPSPRLPGHNNHDLTLESVSFQQKKSWVGGYLSQLKGLVYNRFVGANSRLHYFPASIKHPHCMCGCFTHFKFG